MPKKQSTAAKKARAVQRAAGGKHTARLAAQKKPPIRLRLTWEEREGEYWTTYRGRHYALVVHGDWHSPDGGGPNGRDVWYLHEMWENGQIRPEGEDGAFEGWWIAGAARIRNLLRHPDLMRIAELHIDGWHWSTAYPDGTRSMSRSTYARRRPLPELLASATLGPWPIPDGICGSFTHPLDPDDYLPCPHPRGHDFPCNDNPAFDAAAWRAKQAAEQAAEEARRAALTPQERAQEDEEARDWQYAEMRAAADPADDFDYMDYDED